MCWLYLLSDDGLKTPCTSVSADGFCSVCFQMMTFKKSMLVVLRGRRVLQCLLSDDDFKTFMHVVVRGGWVLQCLLSDDDFQEVHARRF